MEDLDFPRNQPGADKLILGQLKALGMQWDGEVAYQSKRVELYQAAFDRLQLENLVYPCGCTRKEIADSVLRLQGQFPEGERPYPGTCRTGVALGRTALSWRLRVPQGEIRFKDRWLGDCTQDVCKAVGDFVLRRADGVWSYQLAVVVDDADQGVTDIVRGEDLYGSTARQILLRQMLGYAIPSVLHVPLALDGRGLKLSKQNGAPAINLENPLESLQKTWEFLGFNRVSTKNLDTFLALTTQIWGQTSRRANLHGNS
jgi:glutamyl-Q tRNA(Asp) synthetase